MTEKANKYPSMQSLIKNFPYFLKYYTKNCPFTNPGQLEYHRNTIHRRLNLGSAKAALEDEDYLKSLYLTLQAWGIGARASKLKSFDSFVSSLSEMAPEICKLDGLKLDNKELEIDTVIQNIWNIINKMQRTSNLLL